jgi:NADH dehydrogenase [ubiquinone] 1 alpha subcomplex assembly factor 7
VTPLERALHARIRADGPITLEAYMAACNAYYYATRDPLGAAGDFTTAPEVSQMFGELVGAALADCWKRAGEPDNAVYVELGPGRGTLAADALRVLRHGGFTGHTHLIETSPVLQEAQRQTLGDASWHETIDGLPAAPALIVANEFLDALPVRQHVGGVERHVTIVGGHLAFDRDGEIVETSPARGEAVEALATHVVAHGGAALLSDYGHAASAAGDTLQAVRGHRHAPILESPGEQDLTAHVDFQAVARSGTDAGASVTELTSQGRWLRALGIEARAGALSQANRKRAEEVDAALHRLTAADEMGELFKVIAIHSPAWPRPMGFA